MKCFPEDMAPGQYADVSRPFPGDHALDVPSLGRQIVQPQHRVLILPQQGLGAVSLDIEVISLTNQGSGLPGGVRPSSPTMRKVCCGKLGLNAPYCRGKCSLVKEL